MRSSGPVYVGVLLLELSTPWARSLKEKRSLVTPLTERLKARYPVSVARLDGLDAHDWELVGVTALSHDPVWLESLLERVRGFAGSQEARLSDSRVDIEVWDLAP